MKKISILLVLALFMQIFVFAAAPTVTGSNLGFSGLDGTQFSGSFTQGNGANRIIVIKKGSPVTGLPVNGVEYNSNTVFGSAGSGFTAPGEFVIARTSWSSFNVSNLEPGVTYHIAVFEYNGTGSAIQYLMVPLTGSQSTVVAPTVATTAVALTGTTGNTMSLSWTKGNGTGRIILARKGAPVNVTPADLVNYSAGDNVFEGGSKIGTDNFVVYKSTGTATTIKNLEPNTIYHFAVFEYNGSTSPVHFNSAATFSATTHAGPTIAATSPGFNYIEGNSYTIAVTYGNGSKRLFIAKKGSPVTAVPVNGTAYTANAAFGNPASEIAPGEFVVAATTGNGISVTNLEPNTVYHFRVYEFDADKSGNTYYLTSSYAVKSGSTAYTPSAVATNLRLTSLTGSSATISFTPGTGNYRTVLVRAGSAVNAAPVNLTKYVGNSTFGTGPQIGSGNYVMYWGMNGSAASIYNLVPGTTYHVSIYEYTGYDAPVYTTTGATFSFTVPLEPGAPATTPNTVFGDGRSFRLTWSNGSGGKRMVIAKKGSAVTSKPVDQTIYTANENFGQGQELAAGEFVVYNGTDAYVNLKNMEIGSLYHFAVFEYNVGSDSKPDYLTSSWLAATGSTVGSPTTQTNIGSVSGISATGATINFAKGNGENRIFIMKQGSPVNVLPQDVVKYTYSSSFGAAVSHITDGNYAVMLTSSNGNFSVNGLQANTTYHVSAFEYNGFNEPVYLRTSPSTTSFTTTDVPGATVPTTGASLPIVNAVDGNKFTFKWTNGNGEKRMVVMRQGSAVSFVPASGTSYTANSSFGSGTDLGGGQFIVYSSNGNSVELTNLAPGAGYHFAVYEFNGTGTLIRYIAAPLTATGSTFAAPVTPAGNVATSTASGQLTLNWTNGNGMGRLVIMKENSAVTAVPADLGVYPASTVFGSGSQAAAGEYVVYAGSASSVTVTGLGNGKTYHFRIFEYNGSTAPVYNTNGVTGSAIVSSALPVKLLFFTAKRSAGSVELKWATSEEMNSSHFVVERSTDATTFTAIKTIHSAGNSSSVIAYNHTDVNAPSGKLYYRLRSVDADGTFTYSTVQLVDGGKADIRIYPNPVVNSFRIDLPQGAGVALVAVHDAKGMQVIKQSYQSGQQIETGKWSKGIYYVTVIAGGEEYRGRIVK